VCSAQDGTFKGIEVVIRDAAILEMLYPRSSAKIRGNHFALLAQLIPTRFDSFHYAVAHPRDLLSRKRTIVSAKS
jgi:hypothetical protein